MRSRYQKRTRKQKLLPLGKQEMEWRRTECFDPHVNRGRVCIARRGENPALRPGHEVNAVSSQRMTDGTAEEGFRAVWKNRRTGWEYSLVFRYLGVEIDALNAHQLKVVIHKGGTQLVGGQLYAEEE